MNTQINTHAYITSNDSPSLLLLNTVSNGGVYCFKFRGWGNSRSK